MSSQQYQLRHLFTVAEEPKKEEVSEILENVHFLALENKDTALLWEVNPVYIIVHDLDIAFVRQIEVSIFITRA